MEFRFDDDQLAMRDAVAAFCGDHLDLNRVAEREDRPATKSFGSSAEQATRLRSNIGEET